MLERGGGHGEKWTLLDILGFSISSTENQHDLITTTYPLGMTHFSDIEIKDLPKPGSWDNRTLAGDPGQCVPQIPGGHTWL